MSTCQVLRCQAAVETVHVWEPPGWGRRVEFGVCVAHATRLRDGEEHAYEQERPGQMVILMGDDLVGTGDQLVESISIQSGITLTTPDGLPAIRVVLGTRRRGSGQAEHVEFVASRPVVRRLAEMLQQTVPAAAVGDTEGERV
jgi:hypothetical protein